MRIDIDDLRAVLQPEHVIAACGLDARKRGRAWRLRKCPSCGARPARDGAAIYRRKSDLRWSWTHHGHDCGGDLLDLLAGAEGIDRKRELPKLIDLAAKLAGIAPQDPDLDRRIREHIAADRARVEQEARERDCAIAAMPALWDSLERRSLVGERYLEGRGLEPLVLRTQGDVVRYSDRGEIALPMRHLETGAVVGVQYRSAGEKGFRTAEWSDADDSAMVGRVAELDRDGADVAVLVEGLADTIAARLAFPGCVVFGAAGAGAMESIAEAVAPRIAEIGGWFLLMSDDDDTGVLNTVDAVRAAMNAGLRLAPSPGDLVGRDRVHVIDLGEHHDLADAWRAGWRWCWPRHGGAV